MEFKEALIDILNGGERYQASQKALEEFVRENSSEVVAKKYIELFQLLEKEKEDGGFDHVSRIMKAMETLSIDNKIEKVSIPSSGEMRERRLQTH